MPWTTNTRTHPKRGKGLVWPRFRSCPAPRVFIRPESLRRLGAGDDSLIQCPISQERIFIKEHVCLGGNERIWMSLNKYWPWTPKAEETPLVPSTLGLFVFIVNGQKEEAHWDSSVPFCVHTPGRANWFWRQLHSPIQQHQSELLRHHPKYPPVTHR